VKRGVGFGPAPFFCDPRASSSAPPNFFVSERCFIEGLFDLKFLGHQQRCGADEILGIALSHFIESCFAMRPDPSTRSLDSSTNERFVASITPPTLTVLASA
jgi:hypothetical protein